MIQHVLLREKKKKKMHLIKIHERRKIIFNKLYHFMMVILKIRNKLLRNKIEKKLLRNECRAPHLESREIKYYFNSVFIENIKTLTLSNGS